MHLALKVGEDAEFMESSNPSQNFQSFCESIIRMIFAALDVPFSFYDGSKTNFYGSEGEFEQYLDSVEKKQEPTIFAGKSVGVGRGPRRGGCSGTSRKFRRVLARGLSHRYASRILTAKICCAISTN